MVQCAMFLAMSVVVRLIQNNFPITMGGVQFMKLGLTSPFTLAPAILFGPTYGFIMGMLSDLLNLFTPNQGPWIPALTLIAALRGWLVGLIWQWIKGADPVKVRRWVMGAFSAIGLLGMVNLIMSRFFPASYYAETIIQLNAREKSIPHVVTYGFIVSAIVVFILVGIALKMENSPGIYTKERSGNNTFLLFIAVILPSVMQTTLNTFVLRSIIAAHADIAFMLYFIPRVAKTLIVGIITVLIINDVLLVLYSKIHPEIYRESMDKDRYCKV